MFYDRDYWGASGNLKVELNNVSSTLPLLSYSSLELGCDNKYQTYYRFVADFDHINKTDDPLRFKLSNDQDSLNCQWGLKEQIVLIKKCHSFCTECFSA